MSSSDNPIREDTIKTFLASNKLEERLLGYHLADCLYRDYVGVYLRNWAGRKRCSLGEEDLKECVQIALIALLDKAIDDAFTFDGRLSGFLTTVARRKAIDEIRRRVRRAERYVAVVEEEVVNKPTDDQLQLDDELDAQINHCYDQMQNDRKLVIRIYHQIAVASIDGRVDMKELTREVNKHSAQSVSQSTVKSRLDRGRAEFREQLKRLRGHVD